MWAVERTRIHAQVVTAGWGLAALFAVLGAGCNVALPNGVFSCTADADCPTGFFCHSSSFCYDTQETCTATRECGAIYQCGQIDNGCGELIDCPPCDGGLVCGAGSHAHSCGCEPTTCDALSAECGTPPSGCGGTLLDCGGNDRCKTMGENYDCNAELRCECVPVDREEVCVDKCGVLEDGCGGTIDCGGCTDGQTCGGGGVENVCGMGECEPAIQCDAAFECGRQSDGCDGQLECGRCESNERCDDHACVCVPTTCDQLGYECGRHDDGCGGTLNCGGCDDPETCGDWNGMSNVCGGGCEDLGYECGKPFGSSHPECGFCAEGFVCGGDFNCECATDKYDQEASNDSRDAATALATMERRNFAATWRATLDRAGDRDWYELDLNRHSREFSIRVKGDANFAITVSHSCGLTACTGNFPAAHGRDAPCTANSNVIEFSGHCRGHEEASLTVGIAQSSSAVACVPYEFTVSGSEEDND